MGAQSCLIDFSLLRYAFLLRSQVRTHQPIPYAPQVNVKIMGRFRLALALPLINHYGNLGNYKDAKI